MSQEMTIMADREMGRIAEAICQELHPQLGKAKCWVLISEDHKVSLCHAVCPERRPGDALAVLYLDGRGRGAMSADHATPENQWQAGCRALWACA
jgi:hypothetical protein